MSVSKGKSAIPRKLSLIYNATGQIIGLAILYVILIFLLPASPATMQAYHLSVFEYHVINFAIALPSILVWFAAFVGYAMLKQYAHSLNGSPEATHFDRLADGCAWLAWSLPITALVSLILSSASYKWHGFQATSIIMTNYVNLILPLVAYSVIGKASRGLVSNAKLKLSLASARAVVLIFLAAGVLYCYMAFSHFDLNNLSSTANPYFLPIWLMAFTVIIPYLYAWFIGLLAAYEITLYSKQTTGLLYRGALRLLVAGLVTIIVSSIASQYLNGAEPRVGHLVFSYKLVISVLFHLVGGVGFLVLTIGAFRLKKIEEV